MKRIKIAPRINYKEKLKAIDFNFDENYWMENAYYQFDLNEINKLEHATNECYRMYIAAVEHIIKHNLWEKLAIPDYIVPALIESWERDDLSLYGRFDFAYTNNEFKLLEFNADTPTSIYEASIVQWDWKEDLFKSKTQFNNLHESLIASWSAIASDYKLKTVHFTCIEDDVEDMTSTAYLAETAIQAGINTTLFDIKELGHCVEDNFFYTPDNEEEIECLFKLYPYEWMFTEEFGEHLPKCKTKLIEPLWKAIMSNKYMLKIIYDLFPHSEFILECSDTPLASGNFCKKPIYSREGANVTLVKNLTVIESSIGDYGAEGYIFQELVEIEAHDGMYPVIGSWVIGGESCGMGIRENSSRITDNMSYFVPHIIEWSN